MGILDEDVQRVREATDLVELAREHIALKRVGRRFSGLCPFHHEKSPSFTINQELQVYHCFGCQASGDAITFVRELEHLDFVGAVERLAGRAGIQLRYDDVAFTKERARKQRLHEAVAVAIVFYHDRLLQSDDGGTARRYLRSRGFEGDAVRQFKLGYSPDDWDVLAKHLQAQKFSRDDLVAANLAFVNRANKLQDVFRGRLMFPIWDSRGEAVGFGGRTLSADGPKYINSSESPIYRKSSLLYGLNWAKGEIVARGQVVICEGYTDVMAFHLAGVPQAVATCGTALTDDHFLAMKNLTRKITLAYDADAAGQTAAERCYQWETKFEVQFEVADLPVGRDPGDLWSDDRDRLAKSIEMAKPFLEFRVERLLSAADTTTKEGRARAANQAIAMVAEHPNDLVRDQYVMELAGRLGIDADRLRAEVGNTRRGAKPALGGVRSGAVEPDARRAARSAASIDRRELDALRWAVQEPELVGPHLHHTLFADPTISALYEVLSKAQTFADAVTAATDPEVAAMLQRLAVEETSSGREPNETLAMRVVVNLVEASSQRLLASMLRTEDGRSVEFKSRLDALVGERDAGNWTQAVPIADELVAWIAAAGSDVGSTGGPGDGAGDGAG